MGKSPFHRLPQRLEKMAKPKIVPNTPIKNAIDECLQAQDKVREAKKAHDEALKEYNAKLKEHFGYEDGQAILMPQLLALIHTVASEVAK